MPNIASVLKAEIARVARKEIRGDSSQLKSASSRYRSDIADLKRRLSALERQVTALSKRGNARNEASDASTDSDAVHRWRPEGFKKLRAKLGLSANDMGKLLGCSDQSVYKWEDGKTRPRSAQLETIAQVRKLGKREAMKQLAAGQE